MEWITSRKNPLMVQIRTLSASRRARRAAGLLLGDGTKLLDEALGTKSVRVVVATKDVLLPPLPDAVRHVQVPEDLMAGLSRMETPQGVLFLCEMPEQGGALTGERYLILDGLQDPGNVGTIWRTADGLGADGLILTDDCADPWNPKTVRASMGACFRLPVWEMTRQALPERLSEAGLPLYAAAMGAGAQDLRQSPIRRGAVVIGNEGAGVSQALLNAAGGRLSIPMRARCESLNAATAAAVILWEMSR